VQSGEPPQAEPPSAAQPPLLLDVTPLSLGVETVSGYCEHIIQRNAAIPVEQTRTFSTARDRQEVVRVQICQGESRRLDENQPLGEIELSGLRSAPRGQVHIGVTFIIGADGILAVRAQDLETLQEQSIRINLIGGMQEEEIERMQQRHASLFSEQATGPHG
jgi:molecular chaperone DnaK